VDAGALSSTASRSFLGIVAVASVLATLSTCSRRARPWASPR